MSLRPRAAERQGDAPPPAAGPILLAERQGVAFVAVSRAAHGDAALPPELRGPGVVFIPAHEDEVRAADAVRPPGTVGPPRAVARPDLLVPGLSRILGGEYVEMRLHAEHDGLKATLLATSGQVHPFPVSPKDSLALLAAVFARAPRGVITLGTARSGRVLLAVSPGDGPHEYRVRLAAAITGPAPATLADAGVSSALLEVLTEAIDRLAGVLLVSGGSGSGRSTTLTLLEAALLARGRKGGLIGAPRPGTDPQLAWLAGSIGDWPFPESLKESAADFVVLERQGHPEELHLAARLAATGVLVLAETKAADPRALVARLASEWAQEAEASVPAMVLSQALVRAVCRECAAWNSMPAAQAVRLGFHRWDLEEIDRRGGLPVPVGQGCESCARTGFRGLTALFGFASSDALGLSLPTLREEGWRLVAEGVAGHDDVRALPGAPEPMRPLRQVAVLAGATSIPLNEARGTRTPPLEIDIQAAPALPPAAARPTPVQGSTLPDVETIVRLFRGAQTGKPPHPVALAELARGLAGRATQGALQDSLAGPRGRFHFGRHAVNTALIAVRVVSALGQNEDAPGTATLALLHDLGLLGTGIDPGAERAGVESEAEMDESGLRLHPEKFLAAISVPDAGLAARITEVHEILGAPSPAADRPQADLRTQAVALASVIDLTYHASTGAAADLHDVSSLIMAQHGQRFSPILFRALLRAIPIFPIGCVVELSSGDLARVVSHNDANHFRPRIEITSGPSRTGDRRTIDLSRSPFLHIRQRVTQAGDPPREGAAR